MPRPPQQWTFRPLSYPIIPGVRTVKDAIVSWVVFSMIAIDYFGPESGSAIMFVMLIGGIIWFTRSKWRLWQWYRQHDEYVRLGDTALHFCIYPQSGSLHYADIVQVIHWYEERMTGKDEEVYDKNIGIIITTRQQRTIHLNLERMVQGGDGISFGENSGIVIRALEEKMKWRRPAGRVRP